MFESRFITADDLLTWEIQFKREGTLPPEVQRLLLEAALKRDHCVVVGESE